MLPPSVKSLADITGYSDQQDRVVYLAKLLEYILKETTPEPCEDFRQLIDANEAQFSNCRLVQQARSVRNKITHGDRNLKPTHVRTAERTFLIAINEVLPGCPESLRVDVRGPVKPPPRPVEAPYQSPRPAPSEPPTPPQFIAAPSRQPPLQPSRPNFTGAFFVLGGICLLFAFVFYVARSRTSVPSDYVERSKRSESSPIVSSNGDASRPVSTASAPVNVATRPVVTKCVDQATGSNMVEGRPQTVRITCFGTGFEGVQQVSSGGSSDYQTVFVSSDHTTLVFDLVVSRDLLYSLLGARFYIDGELLQIPDKMPNDGRLRILTPRAFAEATGSVCPVGTVRGLRTPEGSIRGGCSDIPPQSLSELPQSVGLAAEYGYIDLLKRQLAEGKDINEPGPENTTPLMYAIAQGRMDVVRFLIDQGADTNARMKNGMSVLGVAKSYENQDIIRLLSVAGAHE
jgi:hypothetical protein